MDTRELSLRKISKVGLTAIGILFVGSLFFFKELLFGDTSYILFNIINFGKLDIQDERIGSFITQIVPYTCQKMHLSLEGCIRCYVSSFYAFYLLTAALLVYPLRQYNLAIVITLGLFLFVSDSYFWPIDEINQAICWMFLWLGVTLAFGKKRTNIFFIAVLFLLLSFLTVSTHYVIIIPLVFLWIFLIIDKTQWPFSKSNTIALSALLVSVVVFKFQTTAHSQDYESKHLEKLIKFSPQDIFTAITSPEVYKFYYRCLTNYWIAILLFIADIIILLKTRRIMQLVWLVLSVFGYIVLNGLVFGYGGDIPLFHIESEWKSLGIILATPFVYYLLPEISYKVSLSTFVMIMVIRLFYICCAANIFVAHTHINEEILAQMRKKGVTKIALLMYDHALLDKYIMVWTSTYESLLISALEGDQPQRTFVLLDKDEKEKLSFIQDPKSFFDTWYMCPYQQLNSNYFHIDTTGPYMVMPYDAFMKQ